MDGYDLLVVGGGINGAAVARDAAGRGLSVLLVEQGDLASATSSASTKLIHGGLRYLEQGAFGLVRESLAERATMLRSAPHLVRPMRFILPIGQGGRPGWMIRAGLLLYDLFALGGGLPRSRRVRLGGGPLNAGVTHGFAYWDAWVDDSRLVILNAIDARCHGAIIRPRTRLASARREGGRWLATIEDATTGAVEAVSARGLANMAGPWVDAVLREALGVTSAARARLIRGSHIVMPRIAGHDDAMLLQQPDGRVVFLIPYEARFSLIGTTDVAVDDPADAAISDGEVDYLLAAANRWLATPIARADIVHSYAGVRSLFDDGAADGKAVTRDYRLELDSDMRAAPLITAFGGKITTARALAEVAVDRLALNDAPAWTRGATLPGGDLDGGFAGALAQTIADHPALGAARAARMLHAYGSMLHEMLHDGPGEELGAGLTTGEIDWLVDREWAMTAEDILWRRTRIGLDAPPGLARLIDDYLEQRRR